LRSATQRDCGRPTHEKRAADRVQNKALGARLVDKYGKR
jgi:hypothetical protein